MFLCLTSFYDAAIIKAADCSSLSFLKLMKRIHTRATHIIFNQDPFLQEFIRMLFSKLLDSTDRNLCCFLYWTAGYPHQR